MPSSGIRRCVHLVCHFSTSLRLRSLRTASFTRTFSCRLVKQVTSLRSNVGHGSSQSGSTLDGFGSRYLQVFAEARPSIQLHTQVFNAISPLNFMFPENDLRVLEGFPVRDQQNLGLFRVHSQASAIQPTLCPPGHHRLSLILSPRILTSSASFPPRYWSWQYFSFLEKV